jgi:RNA polymerase sigma-70 factor (ECF subfamily)
MSEEMTEQGQWIASHIIPWESQVRGWLRRIVPRGLEVDDVIQEAYAILSSLADISRIGNPRAYFYQVVKSLISEHFRRAATSGAAFDVESVAEPEEGLTPERILSGRQELDRLYRAITRLSEPARSIFIMRKIDNLPQKVIAARMRVSENIVENHVARGLRVMLQQFAREDGSNQDESAIPIKKRKAGPSDA